MVLNCGVGEDSWVLWTASSSNQSILKDRDLDLDLKDLKDSWGHKVNWTDTTVDTSAFFAWKIKNL